jgi:hypothetical protein
MSHARDPQRHIHLRAERAQSRSMHLLRGAFPDLARASRVRESPRAGRADRRHRQSPSRTCRKPPSSAMSFIGSTISRARPAPAGQRASRYGSARSPTFRPSISEHTTFSRSAGHARRRSDPGHRGVGRSRRPARPACPAGERRPRRVNADWSIGKEDRGFLQCRPAVAPKAGLC